MLRRKYLLLLLHRTERRLASPLELLHLFSLGLLGLHCTQRHTNWEAGAAVLLCWVKKRLALSSGVSPSDSIRKSGWQPLHSSPPPASSSSTAAVAPTAPTVQQDQQLQQRQQHHQYQRQPNHKKKKGKKRRRQRETHRTSAVRRCVSSNCRKRSASSLFTNSSFSATVAGTGGRLGGSGMVSTASPFEETASSFSPAEEVSNESCCSVCVARDSYGHRLLNPHDVAVSDARAQVHPTRKSRDDTRMRLPCGPHRHTHRTALSQRWGGCSLQHNRHSYGIVDYYVLISVTMMAGSDLLASTAAYLRRRCHHRQRVCSAASLVWPLVCFRRIGIDLRAG